VILCGMSCDHRCRIELGSFRVLRTLRVICAAALFEPPRLVRQRTDKARTTR
jgi:hypothetical protein